MRMLVSLAATLSLAPALFGQARPPVILVDGSIEDCSTEAMSSIQWFGKLESSLTAKNIRTKYFSPCSVPSKAGAARATLEEMGEALGALIDQVADPQVDVIAYSMGGTIVRCYLSGKQSMPGLFKPPAEHKVRKLVFLAPAHFGFPELGLAYTNAQVQAMEYGSRLQWDLGTWNQGRDDIRQIDAVALVGELSPSVPKWPTMAAHSNSDGRVMTSSGSLLFAFPAARTRMITGCHIRQWCKPGVAHVSLDQHPAWLLIDSFLSDTESWRTLGHSPDEDRNLSQRGGLMVAVKDAQDNLIQDAQLWMSQTVVRKGVAPDTVGTFVEDSVDKGEYTLRATASVPVPDRTITVVPGTFTVVTMKPGPLIAGVAPADTGAKSPSMPAGAIISISGERLGTGETTASAPFPTTLGSTTVTVNDQPLPLMYVSESRIKTRLPEGVTGFARLSVKTGEGTHGFNFFISPRRWIVPQVADGGGWRTTLTLSNPTNQGAGYEVDLKDDAANALTISTSAGQTGSRFTGTLPAGASVTLASSGRRDLAQGIADIAGNGALVANAILSTSSPSGATLEAAVPAVSLPAQSLLLPFDNESGKSTGLALANVDNWNTIATLTFRSTDGSVFSVEKLPMNAGTKTAFNIADRFSATQSQRGTVAIAAEASAVAALGLRFLQEGTFTTLPVYVLGGLGQAVQRKVLSHVVDGGSWQSAITIVNLDSQPADYQLRVFDGAGAPLSLSWNGVADSKFSGTIAPLSSATLNTPGTSSSVVEGWADITSNRQLGAHLVFTQAVPNRLRFEAAVPAVSDAQNSVAMPYDNSGGLLTCIAVANPGTAPASIQMSVRDEQGNVIGSKPIRLDPGAKKVLVLPDLVDGTAGKRGLLHMVSPTGSIAALALRFNGTAFTTVPVVAADPPTAP
jgi:uncharacterized protein (TIGR03437 family)